MGQTRSVNCWVGEKSSRIKMHCSKSTADFVKGVSVVFALSAILMFVSHSITFAHLAESILNQYATVHGQPFVYGGKPHYVIYQFYNRLLFPLVFVFFTKILRGWTDVQIFLLLRFLSFVICLSAIYVAACRRCNSSTSDILTVCFALALSMIPTFNNEWVNTSDIFDLAFSFFIFLYVAEDKFLLAFLVACLTAINRETGPFGAVAYICIAFGTQKSNLIAARAFVMGFVPYLGAILVRKIVLGDQLPHLSTGMSLSYNLELLIEALRRPSPTGWVGSQLPLLSTGQLYALSHNLELLIEALRRPSPTGWPVLLFGMMVFPWLVFLSRNAATVFKVRVTIAFLAIFCVTLVFGISAEERVFIPCVGLLIGCALAHVSLNTSESEIKRQRAT